MPGLDVWIVVAVVVAIVAALIVRLSLWPKMDLIETHETAVAGTAVLLCMASYVLLLATVGAGIALKTWLDSGTIALLVMLPAAFTFLFPLAVACLAYMRLPVVLRKTFEADAEAGPELRAAAQEAMDALGIRSAVVVRVSAGKHRYHGPRTFGRWGAPPVAVFPSNLEEAAGIAAGGNPGAAKALTRFVVLHELAHIRNGDYHIHSWVLVFLQAMKWWPLVVLPVLAGYSVLAGALQGLAILGGVAWLSIIVTLLFFLSWQPLQRHREKLADARAASCLLPEEIRLLIEPREGGPAPEEAFEVYVKVREGLAPGAPSTGGRFLPVKRLLGGAVRRFQGLLAPAPPVTSAGFLQRLIATHPQSEDRRALLTSGELLAESKQQLSYSTVASVFASVGLAFLALTFLVAMPSALLDLPVWTAPLVGLLPITVFAAASLLCTPFRNVTTAAAPLRVAIPALLGRSIVGGASAAVLFLAVGLPILVVNPAQGLQFLGALVLLCLLLSGGTFLISVLLATMMRFGVQLRVLIPSTKAWGRVFLATLVAFVLLAAVTMAGALLWDAVGDLWRESPAWVASIFVLALSGALWAVTVCGRRCFQLPSDAVRVPQEMWRDSLAAAFLMAAVFALLAWAGVSLARTINGALLPAYSHLVPWAASIALAGAATAMLLLLRSVQRHSDVVLSSWSERADLLGFTGQTLSPDTQEWLASHVVSCHAPEGGYGWRPGARPDLDTSRHALSVLKAAGKGSPDSVLDARWVLRHQASGGGFTRREGGRPSLGATRAALACLGYLQHGLPEDERRTATSWVCASQREDGGFSDEVGPGRSGLEATFDAVACLQRLGGLDCIARAAARRFVSRAWAKSARTVDETYWAVYALCGLGGLDDAMATAVRTWCLSLAPWLLRLNPRRQAAPFYRVLWVISQLPGGEVDEALARLDALIRARVQQVCEDALPGRSE